MIAIDEPPCFWLRLAPAGPLQVALGGDLPAATMWKLLSDPRIPALVREHKPLRAVLDLTFATSLPADALELATGWWSSQLAAIGCLRVAVVMRPEVLWQKWAPPPAQVELFDTRATADQWLARSPPPASASAPLAPVSSVSAVEIASQSKPASASAPPEARVAVPVRKPRGPVLEARCTAEAQLYMNIRGVSPAPIRQVIQTADGPVAVFAPAGDDGARDEEFAFRIAEPEGELGAGGVRGPSTLLGPAEFITWADILSKRNPASPDGLSAQERETAGRETLTAALCTEEVLKFVPPGGNSVPESAFQGEAARGVYAKEPGRFHGARLEAVAQAYRRVASRFGAGRG